MKRLLSVLFSLILFVMVTASCDLPMPNSGVSSSQATSESGSEFENVEILFLTENDLTIEVGDTYQLEWQLIGEYYGEITWRTSNGYLSISPSGLATGMMAGQTRVTVCAGEASDSINVIVKEKENQDTNPYIGIDVNEFYANYTPATSYWDAVYRTEAYLMSGSISDQDQAPTIAEVQPSYNHVYIKNSEGVYSTDKKTYYVLDSNGNVALQVYKDCAYVSLEEVAAYLFAFNTVPANYVENKKTTPSQSKWGKFLRLNHSKFSGNTSKYPYEPVLPNISGCGGSYDYYEVDIGTTGTDCDPNYTATIYNNGYSITRGAARIVYSRYENGSPITDLTKKYLFYTYNHYNDFQEYLNYYNGWGEMFGNITGGGKISSKYDYNPTPYVEVTLYNFLNYNENSPLSVFGKYAQTDYSYGA